MRRPGLSRQTGDGHDMYHGMYQLPIAGEFY